MHSDGWDGVFFFCSFFVLALMEAWHGVDSNQKDETWALWNGIHRIFDSFSCMFLHDVLFAKLGGWHINLAAIFFIVKTEGMEVL